MKITYKGLVIEFPFTLESIEEVGMKSCFCEHPTFTLQAVIPEKEADTYISRISGNTHLKVDYTKEEDKKEEPLFYGFVDSVKVVPKGGLFYLYLQATAFSARMDYEKKSRSFFKKGITYQEIFRSVLKDYEKADMIENIESDRVVDFPIIQYQETDWEFVKRLASLFEAVVTPDCTAEYPRFTLGRPRAGKVSTIQGEELATIRDLASCMKDYYKSFTSVSILKMKKEEEAAKAAAKAAASGKGNQLIGIQKEEDSSMKELFFTTFSIRSMRYFPVGSMLQVKGISLMVTHVEAYVENEILYYEYIVRWPDAILARYEDNPALQGVSLVGTVKKCVGNIVSIRLEIDQDDGYKDDKEDHYFVYAIESKAYYCMPVQGALIHLYFPTGKEWEAIAVNSLRSAGASSQRANKTENPQNKSLSNDSGVSVELSPNAITLTPHDDNQVKIKLEKDGTVSLEGKDITMTGENINLGKSIPYSSVKGASAKEIICKNLKLTAKDTFYATRFQGGGSLTDLVPIDDHFIGIKSVAQLYSSGSIYHDTTGAGKAPLVSYDDSELLASEKEAADKQNEDITQTLIQRKKEARSVFGKGLLMFALGAALAVATVATGGAALAVVAGVGMTVFGAAEMQEGISSKELAESGDWSTPATNTLKSLVPDPYYTILKNGFCIAGSVLFAGPAVLIGGALNSAITIGFDLIPDGRIDTDWKTLLNDFSMGCMITSVTGPIGKLGNCEKVASKIGYKFLQQMAASTLYNVASGDLDLKNFAQNLVREGISSLIAGRVGNKALSALVDVATDTALDSGMQVWDILASGGKLSDFDTRRLAETAIRSLIMNAVYSCDPVDCARGNLFYYKKDLASDDLYGEFAFERRYDSVLAYNGTMGKGWLHSFESFLMAENGGKIIALLPDTHIETFVYSNGNWVNEKEGNQQFTLTYCLEDKNFHLTSLEGGDYRKYTYDSLGRLIYITYKENTTPCKITYQANWEHGTEGTLVREARNYTSYWQIDTITSPGGRVFEFSYTKGCLTSVKDQGNRMVRYEYENGRLVTAYYPTGGRQDYCYDKDGHLIAMKGEDGRDFIRNEFDYDGRVVKQHYPDGNYCTIAYDQRNRETLFTYSDTSRTEHYYYDRQQQITRMDFGEGIEERYAYDQWGNRTEVTDRNGNTIYRTFNCYGQKLEEKFPDGLVINNEYNDKQKLVKEFDNEGTKKEYLYDKSGNPVEIREYITDYSYVITSFTYDRLGRILKKTNSEGQVDTYQYDNNSISKPTLWKTAEGDEFYYGYDHAGRQISITSDYGKVEYSYSETGVLNYVKDAVGNITRKQVGATGNVMKLIPPNAHREDGEQEAGFTYRYDYLDRLIETKDPYGSIHALKRDMDGNIIKDIHPNTYDSITKDGKGIQIVYDKRQHKIKEITPYGGVRRFLVDKQGNIVKVVQPEDCIESEGCGNGGVVSVLGNGLTENKNSNGYVDNGNGRLEKTLGNDVRVTAEGKEKTSNLEKGISYQYDCRNRLEEVIDTDGTVLRRFIYDKNGRVIKDINADGYAFGTSDETRYGTLYKYNLVGWLLEKREPVDIIGNMNASTVNTSAVNASAVNAGSVNSGSVNSDNVNSASVNADTVKSHIRYNLTVYEYDKIGNCIAEKHSSDYVTETSHPTHYHIIRFTYDKRNRLIRVSDSLGAAMEYEYDCLNNRTLEKARINESKYKITRFEFDSAGRLIKAIAAVDLEDVGEKAKPYIEKAFHTTKFAYDKNGNVTQIITPEGYSIEREYDLLDRITKETQIDKQNGIHRTISYEYDKAGNRIRQTNTNGDGKEYTYDLMNNLIKQIDEEGNVTRYFYNKNNSLMKAVSADNYEEVRDDGKGTTFTYDSFGRIESVRNALGYLEEHNSYSKTGQLLRKADETGVLVEYQYDIGGRVRNIITGEAKLKAESIAKMQGNLSVTGSINTTGDLLNPQVSISSLSNDEYNDLNRRYISQSYTYDASGNITGITDGEGNRTTYQLDDWGRITTIKKPDGSEEHYTYDFAGNITTTTDGRGNTITYLYNSFNKLGEIIDQTGESEYFSYDKQGRLSKHVDRNKNSVIYKLNMDDQLMYKKEERSNQMYSYQYNTEGQLTEAIGGGIKYNYDYTPMGNVKTKYINNKLALQYAYTKSGNVASLLDASGKKTEYTYDALSRATQVVDNGKLLVSYGYHVDNTLAEAKFANGITTTYTYDKDKNHASITTTTKTGEKLFAYQYAYDFNGNRILKQNVKELGARELQKLGNQASGNEPFGNSRLEQEIYGQATSYTYDSLQRIQAVVYPNGVQESFAYDTAGNRALRRYGNLEETYQYDQRNRLTEKISVDLTNAESNYISTYLYDQQGNTLREQTKVYRKENVNVEGIEDDALLQNCEYDYDGFHKATKVKIAYYGNSAITSDTTTSNDSKSPISYSDNNVSNADYKNTSNEITKVHVQENFYDAENLRYGIVEDGQRTNFVTNGWKVLNESDLDFNATKRILLGYGIISSNTLTKDEDGYQFLHWNEHGDTEYITGDDGNVLNRYEYDAFGSLTTAEEIIRNRYTYNGEQYDNITSQYYLRARFYNPLVARFTQEDVYRGDGLNLYAYCANNAVMYVDPSGYSSIEEVLAVLITDDYGNKYVLNNEHGIAIKTNYTNSDNYRGVLQSHHLLQGAWANSNLIDYGYSYKLAPTITLETNRGGVTGLPHTYVTSVQNARDVYSGTLQERLIMGANDLINAGISKKVVIESLEANYKMIEKLNKNNKAAIDEGKLQLLTYSRADIEKALTDEPKKQTGKCSIK